LSYLEAAREMTTRSTVGVPQRETVHSGGQR
jgi:hypothetical protein